MLKGEVVTAVYKVLKEVSPTHRNSDVKFVKEYDLLLIDVNTGELISDVTPLKLPPNVDYVVLTENPLEDIFDALHDK